MLGLQTAPEVLRDHAGGCVSTLGPFLFFSAWLTGRFSPDELRPGRGQIWARSVAGLGDGAGGSMGNWRFLMLHVVIKENALMPVLRSPTIETDLFLKDLLSNCETSDGRLIAPSRLPRASEQTIKPPNNKTAWLVEASEKASKQPQNNTVG